MKTLFYTGLLGLALFEVVNVYFIMPMPGSQEMNSLDLAYFLYTWRWLFRGLFGVMALAGAASAFSVRKKWLPAAALLIAAGVIYETNFEMAAEVMFYQPTTLAMKDAGGNKVKKNRIVIGVAHNGEARAYPIQYLGYHHQVRDTVGGKPIMVTYCTVCRTGRVYEPLVNGRLETFRLVGMDHFNAMFEDRTTKSWWRQVTGEAIAGPMKGQLLPEMPATQTSLSKWFELHPNSLVMQGDSTFQVEYDSMSTYEAGRRTGRLTRRDSLSWKDKSWIAGVALGKESKAYDWNLLQERRVINDVLGGQPVAIVLADDDKSLFAFVRSSGEQRLFLRKDTITDGVQSYDLLGKALSPGSPGLQRINAYQEYWHSWRTFHPATQTFK